MAFRWLKQVFGFGQPSCSKSQLVSSAIRSGADESPLLIQDRAAKSGKSIRTPSGPYTTTFNKPLTLNEQKRVDSRLVKMDRLQKILDTAAGMQHPELAAACSEALGIINYFKTEEGRVEIDLINGNHLAEQIQAIEYLKRPYDDLIAVDNVRVAIIDTETTGLEDEDEPISVGIILIEATGDKGDIVRELDSYYGLREPNVHIHPRAQAVHGIRLDDLKGKRWQSHHILRVLNQADVFISHNAEFDSDMLGRVYGGVSNLNWVCSMRLLSWYWREIGSEGRSLDAICQALDIERPHPHNALSDCRALCSILAIRSGVTERGKTLLGKMLTTHRNGLRTRN